MKALVVGLVRLVECLWTARRTMLPRKSMKHNSIQRIQARRTINTLVHNNSFWYWVPKCVCDSTAISWRTSVHALTTVSISCRSKPYSNQRLTDERSSFIKVISPRHLPIPNLSSKRRRHTLLQGIIVANTPLHSWTLSNPRNPLLEVREVLHLLSR